MLFFQFKNQNNGCIQFYSKYLEICLSLYVEHLCCTWRDVKIRGVGPKILAFIQHLPLSGLP